MLSLACVVIAAARIRVCYFVLAECAMAREFSPEMVRIASEYRKRDVQFELLHEDLSVSTIAMRAHANEFGFVFSVGVDRHHLASKHAHITRVPSAAVYDSAGKVLYAGRIDDRYIKFGTLQSRIKHHDLRTALDRALSGKPKLAKQYESVGCYIPD